MTEKFIINQNGELEDTMAHITFDSFMEILIVLNGQSRHLKKLSDENDQLKQRVTDLNKLLKSETIGKSDGKITKVKTEEFIRICQENTKLKEELESFEQVSFTDLCDGSRTVLYMKKENVGDSE